MSAVKRTSTGDVGWLAIHRRLGGTPVGRDVCIASTPGKISCPYGVRAWHDFLSRCSLFSSQANLKDVSDQVNSVVTDAEQESILTGLLQKVSITSLSKADNRKEGIPSNPKGCTSTPRCPEFSPVAYKRLTSGSQGVLVA